MKKISLVDALESYEQISAHMSLEIFALALVVSLAASFAAAALYRVFYENRGTGSQVSRAFPLLGLSVTTLFVCIQVSIPLSLGLLGSLSIIRFRTPIKEPEEVGFIMLVISGSVAAATYHFAFLAILYALVLLSLLLSRRLRALSAFRRDGLLSLTAPDEALASLSCLEPPLRRHVRRFSVQSAASRDGRTSVQITFGGLRTDVGALQADLRATVPIEAVNVYLDRPGGYR